jgi:oligopeptidase B
MSATTPVSPHDWLKDTTRTNLDVLTHLEAENKATDIALAPLKDLREILESEFVTRAKINRRSPEVLDGPYAYYLEFDAEASQPRHMRRHIESGNIETLLDEEVLAHGAFCDIGDITVSDDHTLLAWSEDRSGDEFYTIFVKNIATGEILAQVEDAAASVVFNKDNHKIVYMTYDDAHRPYQVWAYDIQAAQSTLLLQEDDERFWLDLSTSRDEQWLIVNSESSQTTSEHTLFERTNFLNPTVFSERVEGVYTSLDSYEGKFWVVSNHLRRDNELFVGEPGQLVTQWEKIFTPAEGVNLTGFDLFAKHIAFEMRYNGFNRVAVAARSGTNIGLATWLESSTDASTTSLAENPSATSPYLVIETSDWITPDTTIRYAFADSATLVSDRTIVHSVEVPGYNRNLYTSELKWVTSQDGTLIPYSFISRSDVPFQGTQLWAYGAYGMCEDPGLVETWISLLNRGISCAVAYPRGGAELGRDWYDKGKLEYKQNTFLDMIAVSRDLHEHNCGPLVLRGGSAGGLLVGATINMAPKLFIAAVAEVPFVDVLSTMLDPTLPLTVGEYEEWGNPEDPQVYQRILAYSPIDNVVSQSYPAVLATGGLHDPRVGYWEPAKWVLSLRENTTSDKPVLFRCEMAGHGGSTGRWDKYKESAEIMAFIVNQIELSH